MYMAGPEGAVLVRPLEAEVPAPKPKAPKPRIHPNPAASVTTSAPEEAQANASGQASTAQTETMQPNPSEVDAAQAPQTSQEATAAQSVPEAPAQNEATAGQQETNEGEALTLQADRERVQAVVNQIVDRRITNARERYNKLKASDPAAAQALIAEGSATRAMLELGMLRDGVQVDYVNPLEVELGGKKIKILGIVGRNGENLTCRIEGESGTIEDTIPVEAAVNAKLKGDEAILAEFPPGHPQRELLELYINVLRGGGTTADSEQVQKAVQEAKANLDGAEWESPIAKMLKERIGAVEIEIKARAGRREDVAGYRLVRGALKAAQASKGDLGIIFQGGALQAAGIGPAALETAIPGYSEQVAQAIEIMIDCLHPTDEKIAAIKVAGNDVGLAAKIIEGALLNNNKNNKEIEQLVFGRELEEGELAKLLGLDPKKSKGNAGLLLLIAFLVQEMAKSLVGKQGG